MSEIKTGFTGDKTAAIKNVLVEQKNETATQEHLVPNDTECQQAFETLLPEVQGLVAAVR